MNVLFAGWLEIRFESDWILADAPINEVQNRSTYETNNRLNWTTKGLK